MPATPPSPRRHRRRATVALGAAALLAPLVASAPGAGADADTGALQDAYSAAADRYDVPRSVLLGVSYMQSRWDGHDGAASVAGGYGPMHLTDLRTALEDAGEHHHSDEEDPRGDTSRPLPPRDADAAHEASQPKGEMPARLRTLDRAADLTGLSPEELREDSAANIAGGAALLADAQREAGLPLSEDPADWFGAVARYSGATDEATASVYAGDVYDLIQDGASRVTDSGRRVTLTAAPEVKPDTAQVKALGLKPTKPDPNVECPRTIACEWIPSPYEKTGTEPGDYGNHDKANRPVSQDVDYIVIHNMEGYYQGSLGLVQDPNYVSWQYSLRSTDGHVAQHVKAKDVAWQAGNWYVNSKSIGLEHEGFLANPDAWYTETMYRASARLVRHLSRENDIPLDRHHVIGHYNVPGTTPATIPGMHTDPGPFWDWRHYFRLLGKPFHPTAGPGSGMVTIAPDYDEHRPVLTGCDKADRTAPCPSHGSETVHLRTGPSADAPLVKDKGLRPTGADSTTDIYDIGARASTGQQYAVAGREGDWTAIWYLGQKAWFHDPRGERTAMPARGEVVTPKAGRDTVPVYGRAYPEAEAYPAGITPQELVPLPYEFAAGQSYVLGLRTQGEYYSSPVYNLEGGTVVRGETTYYQIQFGHRIAFVKADDVDVRRVR